MIPGTTLAIDDMEGNTQPHVVSQIYLPWLNPPLTDNSKVGGMDSEADHTLFQMEHSGDGEDGMIARTEPLVVRRDRSVEDTPKSPMEHSVD